MRFWLNVGGTTQDSDGLVNRVDVALRTQDCALAPIGASVSGFASHVSLSLDA